MPEVVGEYIDRLCTVEMRMAGLPRGTIHRFYEAARAHYGRPLTLLAAERLQAACREGGTVLIGTGVGAPPWLGQGETDGPLGAVSLALALAGAYGVVPIFVSEEPYIAHIVAPAHAAGLAVMDYEWARQRTYAAAVEVQSLDPEQGPRQAEELLERYQPRAIITVEKTGPNHHDVFHSVLGRGRPSRPTYFDLVVEKARAQGVLSVGVGDGGNEIGYGVIRDAVRELTPYGATCQCPCGGGIATVVETDVLVVAAVSNWGAYGVAACLAFLERNPALLHDEETERRMLEACTAAGGGDGALGRPLLMVDGIPLNAQQGIINLLHALVDNALFTLDRQF